MERAFEVVTDAFGNVIEIREIATFDSCILSILFIIVAVPLGIFFWLIWAVCYLLFNLVIEGFRALFKKKFAKALLYLAVPIVVTGVSFYFGWNYGGRELTIKAVKAAAYYRQNTAKYIGEDEGTIRGYFTFPVEHKKDCKISNRSILGYNYNKNTYLVPVELNPTIVQQIQCWEDYLPSVLFLKFNNQEDLQSYLSWITEKGIGGATLTTTESTKEGVFLGFEQYFTNYDLTKRTGSIIVWTVDKYYLVGLLESVDRYGSSDVGVTDLEYRWWGIVSQHH